MTRSVEEFNKYQTNDDKLAIGSADIVAPMRIEAALSEGEKRALINATVDLRRCLTEAGRSEFPTEARFLSRLSEIEPASAPRLVVTSLLPLMTEPEDPFAVVEQRLRESLSKLAFDGFSKVFVCTVFRRIGHKNVLQNSKERRIERIRRLNLLAAQLSHELDINIIDFDRSFAHFGGRVLDVDFNLEGSAAVVAAKHVIISTFFAAGLDEFCSPELQDKAKQLYEQHYRETVVPSQQYLNASTMMFRLADNEKSHQTYALTPTRRTLADLWFNCRIGRATLSETLQIILRAVWKRLFTRRPNA
jgi:hypothetical protein